MKAYISHIEYYLPPMVEENPLGRLRKKTGIEHRHICAPNETAADLAVRAAEKLFNVGVARQTIDYIVFCTQSPDYILPTTACLLQERLALPCSCGAVDVNLGCSGYVYGLGLAKGLIETDQAKNILLLTAETYSKYINEQDMATKPLFGDAATATLVVGLENNSPGIYAMAYGTDGRGYDKLIVPVGGLRHRYQHTTKEVIHDSHNNLRTNYDLYLDGASIMKFALNVVPSTVQAVLQKSNLKKSDIDYFIFHQANKFMLEYLQQICELQDCPYWNDVKEYGNTVSNSLPIAIKDMSESSANIPLAKVMLLGFGVGLSWAGCIVDLRRMKP